GAVRPGTDRRRRRARLPGGRGRARPSRADGSEAAGGDLSVLRETSSQGGVKERQPRRREEREGRREGEEDGGWRMEDGGSRMDDRKAPHCHPERSEGSQPFEGL